MSVFGSPANRFAERRLPLVSASAANKKVLTGQFPAIVKFLTCVFCSFGYDQIMYMNSLGMCRILGVSDDSTLSLEPSDVEP